jgi:hypothetical protein
MIEFDYMGIGPSPIIAGGKFPGVTTNQIEAMRNDWRISGPTIFYFKASTLSSEITLGLFPQIFDWN